MKKLFFAFFCGALLMSCNSVKNAQQSQEQLAQKLKLKGDWEITSVSTSKGFVAKNVFDTGMKADCFMGSVWTLVPNNGKGSFRINSADCGTWTQNIIFDVTKDNQFQFKKIFEGDKAKNVTSGYVLQIKDQAADQFTLSQSLPSDGQYVTINYIFQRIK